jgi:hypothetical protein
MATPIGTNVVNSIARRYIVPEITDNIYASNPLFFRLNQANKISVRGGYQIEAPLLYSRFVAGGAYSGLDLLDVTPSDTIRNAAWDWKQYYVPVTVDGLTLIKTDSPEAIADFIRQYFAQAEMELSEFLGDGVWSNGVSNTKKIDGIQGAVDDGTVLTTYGGLSRSTFTWWKSVVDASTTQLTLTALQTQFGSQTIGGRHPTLIVTTQANYNRYWVLNTAKQNFYVQPVAVDEQLANAGFTNVLFNGVPFLVDSHAPDNSIYLLNEDFINLAVSPRGDFYMEDFQTAINQDAMVAKLFWAGNLFFTNCKLQGKFTAITS